MINTISKITQPCLVLITFFCLTANVAVAKGRWKEGYVINAGGDTLRGKLLFIEKNHPPHSVVFKGKDNVKHIYTPADIKGFGVRLLLQDLFFTSFTTNIDVSSTALENANFSSEPHMVPSAFFAMLLVSGPKNMYAYKDTIVGKHHYLIEQDGKLTDLIYKRYYTDPVNITYNEAYKDQLTKFYPDCAATNTKNVTSIPFEQGALMNAAKAYDKCLGITDSYVFKQEKSDAIVSFVIGGDMTTAHAGMVTYKPSYFADFGLSLNLIAPHTEKKWSFYNEILITHYDMKSNEFDNFGAHDYAEISATYAKLFTAVRYQYPYYNVKPFIIAGIVNGYALSLNSDVPDLHGTTTGPAYALTDTRKYEQSLFLSLGASYKAYEAEVRVEHGNGFLNDAGARMHYYRLLFKYALNNKNITPHRRTYEW